MPAGSNSYWDSGYSGYGGGHSGGDKDGGGGGESGGGKGHYHGQTVGSVKEASIRYADARDQVNETEKGSGERQEALKELEDAGKNLDLVK